MKKILLLLIIPLMLCGEARNRHVSQEWNTDAINLEQNIFASNAWHVSPWLGVYFQTDEWWIYHCDKGWMYPESDGAGGVWLFRERTGNWIWTNRDVYPFAWDSFTKNWINFCE
jgi:hypothetical protein